MKSSLRRLAFALALVLVLPACSDDSEESNATANNANAENNANAQNAGNNANAQNSTNQSNSGTDCITAQNELASAIRALPRECINNSDCMIVDRAANCECANSIRDGADLTEFERALAALDAGMCGHPFACAQPMCPYESGFDGAEVVPVCQLDGTCGLTSAISCDVYATKIYGGITPGGACNTAADCVLRDDLNPCGCNEAVTTNFPILLAQAIYEMMELNMSRCQYTCNVCPNVTGVDCVDDGNGGRMCVSTM